MQISNFIKAGRTYGRTKEQTNEIGLQVDHVLEAVNNLQGAAKKVIPCRILQIFKQPLRIF